jgi:hypothetical protein
LNLKKKENAMSLKMMIVSNSQNLISTLQVRPEAEETTRRLVAEANLDGFLTIDWDEYEDSRRIEIYGRKTRQAAQRSR